FDRRSYSLGSTHPETGFALGNLGYAHLREGRCRDAIPQLTNALKITSNALGAFHPRIAAIQSNLALAYDASGQSGLALVTEQRAQGVAFSATKDVFQFVSEAEMDAY